MQRLKNYRVVIHIKYHNLCIILILSFLLDLQRRIKCVKLRLLGGPVGPPPCLTPKSARGPSPQGGGQSIMFDIGFGNTCQIKKVTARVARASLRSHPEEPP